jgi:glutamate-1-semialdehyde 2,1-aminomutase
VTYGKIIGGGFPVGAYGGRSDLMEMIAPSGPVYQAGTLSANPVAMTAGIVTLLKLKRENPYEQLERQTEELTKSLDEVARQAGFPAHVQRYASLFWMVLDEAGSSQKVVRAPSDTPTSHKEKYAKIYHSLLEKGVYLAPSAFEVSFLSTAHQSHILKDLWMV